jgi:hypothetical protein
LGEDLVGDSVDEVLRRLAGDFVGVEGLNSRFMRRGLDFGSSLTVDVSVRLSSDLMFLVLRRLGASVAACAMMDRR